MSRALITGIAGSGGSYMAEHLVAHQKGVEVHGIARVGRHPKLENLSNIKDSVTVHDCDLGDYRQVLSVIEKVKPDYVFHLASNANVRASFDEPLDFLQNNIMGTANLFEALRNAAPAAMIQHCSTSEVYGQVDPKDVPIKEECAMKPASPYAASKVAQDMLAVTYFRAYKSKIVRTRMFAYLNPRRADLFATAFALQVARIEAGKQSELLHGNLDSVRTFIDVRDAMESYWVAATKCLPGEAYNIGGTTTKTVGDFLEILKSRAKVKIVSKQDPKLLRPADVTLQIPDTSKFEKQTGWKPKHAFEESVTHLLEHCRAIVKGER